MNYSIKIANTMVIFNITQFVPDQNLSMSVYLSLFVFGVGPPQVIMDTVELQLGAVQIMKYYLLIEKPNILGCRCIIPSCLITLDCEKEIIEILN
ncbi:hypothetical protein Mgra_00009542 [Meloidogyne graminicola]|uniref:Uncharacterized protein n=1 Tax=Meloidogyne graminicola TaxID=189291 RepID=A0A8S9Z9Q1_9BILA|nr:hypothetical protein Mgra_00009542 [Meloidogyne graminicola]